MPQLFDHHTHSVRSFDGNHPVFALAKQAVERGVSILAVTDHCDLGLQCTADWEERLAGSIREIAEARKDFGGRLTLLTGIELGQPLHDLARAERILSENRFDLVLCSLHNLRETEDFYFFQDDRSRYAPLLERYFSELLEMTRWGNFDVLSHITYPYRYLGYQDTSPISSFEEILRELFTLLAQNGKALEINTSGLYRSPDGRTMPELWELRLFRECGGELVTLGSDAHRAEHVGGGIDAGLALLRAAGFRYQATFANRQSALHPI